MTNLDEDPLSNYWLGPGLVYLLGLLAYFFVVSRINRVPWRDYWSPGFFGLILMALGGYGAVGFRKGFVATMCGSIMMLGLGLAIFFLSPRKSKMK